MGAGLYSEDLYLTAFLRFKRRYHFNIQAQGCLYWGGGGGGYTRKFFLFTSRWVYKCEGLVIGGSRRVRRHSVVSIQRSQWITGKRKSQLFSSSEVIRESKILKFNSKCRKNPLSEWIRQIKSKYGFKGLIHCPCGLRCVCHPTIVLLSGGSLVRT